MKPTSIKNWVTICFCLSLVVSCGPTHKQLDARNRCLEHIHMVHVELSGQWPPNGGVLSSSEALQKLSSQHGIRFVQCPVDGSPYAVCPDAEKWQHPGKAAAEIAVCCPSPHLSSIRGTTLVAVTF